VEKTLVGGLIGGSLVTIINIFFYFYNDAPLFSFENASITVGVVLIILFVISLMIIRKRRKKGSSLD